MLRSLLARALRGGAASTAARFAAIDDTHALIDFRPDGTIINANARFQARSGHTLAALMGEHHAMLLPAAERDTPAHRAFWQRLAGGTPCTGYFRWIDSLGRDLWLQASFTPVRDRRGRVLHVLACGTDVTEPMQRLADMEGQVAAIGRSQAVIEFDMQGQILEANTSFLQTMGYTLDELVGRHHRVFVSAEVARSPGYAEFWQRLAGGRYDAGVYRRQAKGGRDVWIQATYNPIFDHDGRPFKVVKYATDITRPVTSTRMVVDAVERMANVVQTNAVYAEDAKQRAVTAAAQAAHAGTEVDDLVTRMSSLAEESSRISQITAVIDGIAFQTNLLALNAAVEAAHAGHHGRGFAVIAGEIRELARRSALSAKEISALINDSVDRIDTGRQRAVAVGHAMQTLTTTVGDVGMVMARIGAAASEQAAGMNDVSHAILALDHARAA